MGIKDKMKTYNFWISLVSALLLVARILGTKYGFSIDSGLVMDVTTAMCSVFVILGIISAPQKVVTQIKTEYKTPVKEETNEEDISDVGSVVSPAEFITPIALEPQILEPEKEDDGEIEINKGDIEGQTLSEKNDIGATENNDINIEPEIAAPEIVEPEIIEPEAIMAEVIEPEIIEPNQQQTEANDSPIGNLEELDKEALIKLIVSLKK